MAAGSEGKGARRLRVEEVQWRLEDDGGLPDHTGLMEPSAAILGQDRAQGALKLGLELYHRGYNVFVCGIAGVGRATTLKRVLEELKPQCSLSDDLCYVHNFEERSRPVLLTLPRGRAVEFRTAMRDMVRTLQREIPEVINSDEAGRRRARIETRFQQQSQGIAASFKKLIESAGFVLAQVKTPVRIVPDLLYQVGDEAYTIGELDDLVTQEKLGAEEAERAKETYHAFAAELADLISAQQDLQSEHARATAASDREAVSLLLTGLLRNLQRRFPGARTAAWLAMVRKAVLAELDAFIEVERQDESEPGLQAQLSAFDVNVVLTNRTDECPIVVENNPTYDNVFGTYDLDAGDGTDFTRIRPGAIVRAQGGYLIMSADDLLSEDGVWSQLKRALRSGELVIQPPDSPGRRAGPKLTPEPIALLTKVILIGSNGLYNSLYERDRDFAHIFKIKADFDRSIPLNDANVLEYVRVLVHIARGQGLHDFARSAVARILRESIRESGSRRRLSTSFSAMSNLLRESDYFARIESSPRVEERHVRRAVAERRNRSNLYEELLNRQIAEGDVFITTRGSMIGQINGLTVLSTGDYEFGKPARITCRASVGQTGIVNIEREVKLSGATFDKGQLITQGFLNGRYAMERPITVAASISFEQSYTYIDGDSASVAEIFVLMSAIGQVALRQDVAVTGSVDQFGRVQPVGGINEKIEGFYDTCSVQGLTGTQGVLLPAANVDELALSDRVVEAIEGDRFHIWAITDIDEGLELLTGRRAGKRSATGRWTRGSVNDVVQRALDRFGDLSAAAARRGD